MSNATISCFAMSEKTYKGNDLVRGERLQIMLEADELRALDDFRFANRMPSRAAAVRELLRRGLAVDGAVPSSGNGSSQSFGVLDPGQTEGTES
ncbi:MAG TPA: hypothetical protein VGV07_16540 [Devosia sp.]|jgi:hypothetical protein|uniref:hypothetical protein n=1 Tax=Devosia sp. TaxID=1871048 RepID=UPI002DDD287F|nr:hypothetical protein [Devosia sp.]HEV2516866.1 hypothetical protein [Devosia sp.]